ncbi:MAG: hypothetical protein ACYS0C_05045 [Planctomycetota bacterium]|jgi:hypothetical protein
MGQIATKSSLGVSQHEIQGKIRKLAEHLSLRQKSVVLRTSKVLAKLSTSERRAVLNIIRQKDKNGGLNYPWLASFFAVLRKLKAEENQSEAK